MRGEGSRTDGSIHQASEGAVNLIRIMYLMKESRTSIFLEIIGCAERKRTKLQIPTVNSLAKHINGPHSVKFNKELGSSNVRAVIRWRASPIAQFEVYRIAPPSGSIRIFSWTIRYRLRLLFHFSLSAEEDTVDRGNSEQ